MCGLARGRDWEENQTGSSQLQFSLSSVNGTDTLSVEVYSRKGRSTKHFLRV